MLLAEAVVRGLGLFESHNVGDGVGEAHPVGRFLFKLRPAETRERIELGAAIVFRGLPLRGDPAFLFELVKSRVERAVADLQDVAGDLLEAQADGVAVHRLEGQNFQEQQVKSALDQVGRFAHRLSSVTERTVHQLRSVSKGNLCSLRLLECLRLGSELAADGRARFLAFLAHPVKSKSLWVKVPACVSVKAHRDDLLDFTVAAIAFQNWLFHLGVPRGAVFQLVIVPRFAGDASQLDVVEVTVLVEIAPQHDASKEQDCQNQPSCVHAFRFGHLEVLIP
jgi:hypothetical protein